MRILDSLVTLVSYIVKPTKRGLIRQAYQLRRKVGLEVGGPTPFFSLRGGFPVYLFAERIDGVNFSNETIWEGTVKEGKNYNYYSGKTGFQYISEATDLQNIPSKSYDFILSSHCLEHVANPIKALQEWNRILKDEGMLILILPDKDNTFDRKRSYTKYEHLLADYANNTTEDDTTHLEEILETHDEEKSNLKYEVFESMISQNSINRCAHHHVFSLETVKQVLEHTGFKVQSQSKFHPIHLITIARKQK